MNSNRNSQHVTAKANGAPVPRRPPTHAHVWIVTHVGHGRETLFCEVCATYQFNQV